MSGLSRSVWTTLDGLTTTDLEAALRLMARDTLEALRRVGGDRAAVLGGLEVTPHASGVSVAPGALLAPYAGGVGQPRPEECPYVFGRQAAAVPLALAAVDGWLLIQARGVELITNASRNRFDRDLGEMVPVSTPVRAEEQIELGVVVGSTSEIPTPTAGWVPLAAVLRHASGALPTSDELIDLRPRPTPPSVGTALEDVVWQTNTYDLAAQTLALSAFATFEGLELSAFGLTLDPLAYKALAEANPVANETWYLYLAPWQVGAVRAAPYWARPGTLRQRGVLCFSRAAPTSPLPAEPLSPRRNSVALTPPPPFPGTIAPGGALCIGRLRRNAGNTAWVGARAEGTRVSTLGDPADPDLLDKEYSWTGAHNFAFTVGLNDPRLLGTANELQYANADGNVTARERTVLVPLKVSGKWTGENAYAYCSDPNESTPIHLDLPAGAVLTRVRALTVQGNNGGISPMSLKVMRHVTLPNAALVVSELGTTKVRAGVSGFEQLESDVLSEPVNPLAYYRAVIRASLTANTDSDGIAWVSVTFTETRATGHY